MLARPTKLTENLEPAGQDEARTGDRICDRCGGTGLGEEAAESVEVYSRGTRVPLSSCVSCAGTGMRHRQANPLFSWWLRRRRT